MNVKEIKAEPSKTSTKEQYDYKLIFNIAISVTAVVMGVIVFLKLKKVVYEKIHLKSTIIMLLSST
ncbi:hypothetical protein JMF89_17125 [Clostridiaceae bacterium UIB06]|nr:hypothetical protein [Clostridiaceae bacterium UIB06]